MAEAAVGPLDRDGVEACLDRVVASRHFARSRRLSRFLRFVVDETLEGRGDRLKERTIGVEIYGRAVDYEPRIDPIVRTEAHRLRSRLADFFAQEGSAEPIVIELPKGGYAPRIRPNARQADRGAGLRRVSASARDLLSKGRHSALEYGNGFEERNLAAARRRLRAALELEPDYIEALAELAQLELHCLYPPRDEANRILERARALLGRALAIDPNHARSLHLLGHVEGSALRPHVALRLTERAVDLAPDDPEGRTHLAVCYASLGFWESTLFECDRARVLDPVWEAPHRMRLLVLTRMGRFDETRVGIEMLAREGTVPADVTMARFDLCLARGDRAGARAALLAPDAGLLPDQKDRAEIALALLDALDGRHASARRVLEAHRDDPPRFFDHTIRLALALDDDETAVGLLRRSPVHRNYRWIAGETALRPARRNHPRWRDLIDELYASWIRDLDEIGPRLPVRPVALTPPDRSRDVPAADPAPACPA